MNRRKLVSLVMVISMLGLGSPLAAGKAGASATLKIHRSLPKDPVLLVAFSMEDPGGSFDEIMDVIRKIGGEEASTEIAKGLKSLDEKLGFSFRDELLAKLGPDLALVVDLPPLDSFAALMGPGGPAAVKQILGGIGVAGNTSDGKKLAEALARMFTDAGAEAAGDGKTGDLIRFRFKVPMAAHDGPGGPEQGIDLIYWHGKKRFAMGFSEEWVRNVLNGWPAGEVLTNGADYMKVSGHLDAEPSSLFYINLPRIKKLVSESVLIRSFISSNPQAQGMFDWVTGSDFLDIGIGATTVTLDDGARTTYFGPKWTGNGMAMVGMLMAIAVPEMMKDEDESPVTRTKADMQSLAEGIEHYAVDNDAYPGPTDGLQPVDTLEGQLVPGYLQSLPRADAWGGDLLYWSDTSSYKLISKGEDGILNRDWLAGGGSAEPGPGAWDIVLADGAFLAEPGGN